MNIAGISGNLTRDPELRHTPDGTSVCTVRLAVDGMGRGGRDEVGYINVTSFGASAEAAARILTKGWLVEVNGRLQWHEWTDSSENKRESYEVVGQIKFLAAAKDRDGDTPVSDGPVDVSDFAPVPAGVGASNGTPEGDDIPF